MKISVCIATYNGEKYIREQLDSILKQLGENDEVIISDDSSCDKTVSLINEYNDKRIKVLLNQVFKNAIFNFENALKYATGDYIFLSDQDDIWLEGRVNHMIDELKNVDMVVCDHSVIDEKKEVLIDSYFKNIPSGPGIIKNLFKNTYYGCCMAFRKEILTKALPFPKDIPMHDIWLGFVADLYFKSSFINVVYTMYRKHDRNVSIATELKSNNGIIKKLIYRINIIKYLPLLMRR
ncbi:MAG: glycosyltransferase family 2 protein [Flectobacillus sp.]|nr:glycosyltransferase family 2 protein [Flectobacillus sp.]